MRKKGDALSKAWEAINTPLVAADSAMKDQADEEQKERKSLLLAIKRNSRERQARHIAKGMPIKSAQSKENTMSRTRGQSKTHTTGSIAREKQATHAHISKLMDDLPKDKPSKGITVTKKTVSMKPVSKTKPVTLCGLKKKAETMNITPKQRIKLAQALLKQAEDLEKRANVLSSLVKRLLVAGAHGAGRVGQKAGKGIQSLGGKAERFGDIATGERLLFPSTRKMVKGRIGGPAGTKGSYKARPDESWLPRKGNTPKPLPIAGSKTIGSLSQGAGKGLKGGGKDIETLGNVLAGDWHKLPPFLNKGKGVKRGSDNLAAKKRFMLKIAASNLSPREKLAAAGLIGRGLAAGAKALPGLMRGAGKAISRTGSLAGKGLQAAGKGVQSAGQQVRSFAPGVQIPVGAAQQSAKSIGDAGIGVGKAMQAGGRAMRSAPGVAGGAGLAGIAAGRMSKGQPQQAGGGILPTPPGLSQLPGDLNSSMGEMQKSMGGMSPAGTGGVGRFGRSGLHSGLSQLFGNTEQNMPPGVMKNMTQAGGPEMHRAARSMFNPVKQQSRSDF